MKRDIDFDSEQRPKRRWCTMRRKLSFVQKEVDNLLGMQGKVRQDLPGLIVYHGFPKSIHLGNGPESTSIAPIPRRIGLGIGYTCNTYTARRRWRGGAECDARRKPT